MAATSGQVWPVGEVGISSYASNISSGTTVVVTHGLNTLDVLVAVYKISDGVEVDVPFTHTSVNSITLNSAIDLAGHRVVVQGMGGAVTGMSQAAADGRYVELTGDTMTGKFNTLASSTTEAGLKLPHGTAPTTPVDGDTWTTTAGLYARINGTTVGPLGTGGGGVTDHGALTGLADDDHPQYQLVTGKAAASGYASLDAGTKVPIAQIPTGSTNVTVSLGDHTHTSSTISALDAGDITTGTLAYGLLPVGTAASTVAIGDHTHTGSTISALDAGDTTTGTFAYARMPVGTAASTVAIGDHTHAYSATGHTHDGTTISALDAGDTTTGTFALGRLPTGTTSAHVALGDHTHTASTISALDAGDITTGTLAYGLMPVGTAASTIAIGDHTHTASTISALDAGDTTTGTFAIGRIPTGTTSSTVSLGDHLHTGVYDPAGTAAARTPKVTVASSAPGSPTTNDLWVDTT